jgi:hypothetical protein
MIGLILTAILGVPQDSREPKPPATPALFHKRDALTVRRATWVEFFPEWICRERDLDLSVATDDYFRLFYPREWSLLREDEFRLEKRRSELRREIEALRAVTPKQDTFVEDMGMRLGDYDFGRHGFPLFLSSADEGEIITTLSSSRGGGHVVPSDFVLHYDRLPKFVPLGEDAGREWLSRRKRSGWVDRKVFVRLTFKIELLSDRNNFYCNTISAIVYDSRDGAHMTDDKVLFRSPPKQ